MKKWEIKSLGSLCDISSSKRIYQKEYVNDGVLFYRSKEIILKNKNEPITDPLYISPERYKEIEQKFGAPKKGDILLTSVGTIGIPYQVNSNEKFYFKDGNLTWFKNFSNEVNSTFIYYWLQSPLGKKEIDSITIGSTQQALTIDSLKKMNIRIPSIDIQNRICDILLKLDKKIILNKEINKTLEQMAQTLYFHWFVDSGSNRKIELSTIIDLNPRYSIKKGTISKFIDMKALPTDSSSIEIDGITQKAYSSGSKFQNNDVLLARITPCFQNGKAALVKCLENNETAFGSTEFLTLRSNEYSCPTFLYCLCKDPSFLKYAESSMVGTSGRQRIQNDFLLKYELPEPNPEKMIEFKIKTDNWFDLIYKNTKENLVLKQSKNYLIPRLISGEIELDTIENTIKEVISND